MLLEFATLALFVVWFAVSVAAQFSSRLINRVRRFDVFSLIPTWTFFAPTPGQSDYHIIYRSKEENAVLTEWREIPITRRRDIWDFLWNPRKRETKVLADVVNQILMFVDEHRKRETPREVMCNAVMVTTAYLILFSIVQRRGESLLRAANYQFALAESHGFESDEPSLVLCSPFHPVHYAEVIG